MTSSSRVADLKEDILGRTAYPPSLAGLAFKLAKLWSGENPPSPNPDPEEKINVY